MDRINTLVFALIFTIRYFKCFASPTDLVLSSKNYAESTTTGTIHQAENVQQEQILNAVEDPDLNLIQTRLPRVKGLENVATTSEKPQSSSINSKHFPVNDVQGDEAIPSDDVSTASTAKADTLSINDSRTKTSSVDNNDNDVDNEVLQRIEMFKRRILKKLNLKKPPNITNPKQHLPQQVLGNHGNRHHHHRFQDDKESTKVYLLAEQEDLECEDSKKSDCFRFQMKPVPEKQKLAVVHLWVYLGPIVNSTSQKRTLMVNLPSSHYGERHTLATMNVDIDEGWIEIPLGQQIKRYKAADIPSQLHITVTCKPNSPFESYVVNEGAHRPVLALTYVVKNRERRQSNGGQSSCNTTHECCKMSFNVNFADINWDYIIQPQSYNLYYCKGHCLSVSSTGSWSSDHSQAVTTKLLTNPTQNALTAAEKRDIAKDSVCCVPQSFSSLDIVFQEGPDTFKQETLDNMVVDECGCEDELR